MKTVTIYNLKGGVGKTAAAVNLAYLSAADGFRTLLCDFDPQGSTSFYLRIRPPKKLNAKVLVKGDKSLKGSVRESDYPNLDVLPSALSFRKLTRTLNDVKHSKDRIGAALARFRKEYDLVIIDAPASIDLDAENLLRASDLILVPLIPTVLSTNTYHTALSFFSRHKVDPNRIKAFISLADARKTLHREFTEELLSRRDGVLPVVIPYASVVERMGVTRVPVIVSSPRSKASAAFRNLWSEVAQELKVKPVVTPPARDYSP